MFLFLALGYPVFCNLYCVFGLYFCCLLFSSTFLIWKYIRIRLFFSRVIFVLLWYDQLCHYIESSSPNSIYIMFIGESWLFLVLCIHRSLRFHLYITYLWRSFFTSVRFPYFMLQQHHIFPLISNLFFICNILQIMSFPLVSKCPEFIFYIHGHTISLVPRV